MLKFRCSILVAASITVILVASSAATVNAAPERQQTVSGEPSLMDMRAQGAAVCASPPANFSAATATNAELAYYGLPLRPVGSAATIQHWEDNLGHAKHRDCGPAIQSDRTVDGPHNLVQRARGSGKPGGSTGSTYDANTPNWAGVADTDGGFNLVFSDWNVPCYNASKSPSGSTAVQWVGIGGFNSPDIWQAGTETDPGEGYRFWYEDYPNQSIIYYGPPVGCGDHVAVQVDYGYTCAPGYSYFYMSNYSRNRYSSSSCFKFTPSTNSADWIDERVSWNHSTCFTQLADFVETDWSYAQAASTTFNGDHYTPAGDFNVINLIDMYDYGSPSGQLLAYNYSGFVFGDEQFSDSWASNGTQHC